MAAALSPVHKPHARVGNMMPSHAADEHATLSHTSFCFGECTSLRADRIVWIAPRPVHGHVISWKLKRLPC